MKQNTTNKTNKMEMNFCRRCGKPLERKQDHIYECANGHTLFANNSPAVAVFFVSPDKTKVLLATRGIEPRKGMLDAAGGFLEANETFEQGAIRELREELYLEPEDYGPLKYLNNYYDTYPYQNEELSVLTLNFWTTLQPDKAFIAADDVASAAWYPLHEVEISRLHA